MSEVRSFLTRVKAERGMKEKAEALRQTLRCRPWHVGVAIFLLLSPWAFWAILTLRSKSQDTFWFVLVPLVLTPLLVARAMKTRDRAWREFIVGKNPEILREIDEEKSA